jgi:hypothetical protein
MYHVLSGSRLSTLDTSDPAVFVHVHVGGIRRLQTEATNSLTFIPQMIYEYEETRWNDTDRGNSMNWGKICYSATLSATNLTWNDLVVKPDLRVERPGTNGLSYVTAYPAIDWTCRQ